jgi:hypothetical protein
MSEAEQAAWLAGDEAYTAYLTNVAMHESTAFLPHLSLATRQYIQTAGIGLATARAAELCTSAHIAGKNECKIISQALADYVMAPADVKWEEFLATEIAKIGAEQLMLQWFPPQSPEHQAIQHQLQIVYQDVPGGTEVVNQRTFDPKTLLLIAGGVAALVMGAS